MADDYKVLKIRYTFKDNDSVSMITDILIKNLYVVMQAQRGDLPQLKDRTIKQLTNELKIKKYIDIKLYIQDFKMVIANSYESLASVNDMDSVTGFMKPAFAFQQKAIGVTGELTRKMFTGTSRKEYRFEFGINENGDGRGLFNYLFLTMIGYPIGNIGWADKISPEYIANVASAGVGTVLNSLSGGLKATPAIGFATKGLTAGLQYGIYQNHTVFAVPTIDITIQDMFSSGSEDPRFLSVENVNVNGFTCGFVTEKVALIKPTLSDVDVTLKNATNNYSDVKPMFRHINGFISFTEREITNYETFRSSFHGLNN